MTANSSKGMRIVVAEDEATSLLLTQSSLRKAGHTVSVARNGAVALETAKRTKDLDVLVTDWMMPEMDGIELIRRVRAEVRPVPLDKATFFL